MTKLEKLRDEEAENHSSVYINNAIRIRAHVGFQCGWDKRDAIAKEREAKLVEALEFIASPAGQLSITRRSEIVASEALADHKRMMEGEE